jgi:Di- and tricarboxylate transporters
MFVVGVLVAAAVLFASNKIRSDIVALLVVLALMLSGVLTVSQSLAGFADPVVILIAALFVVGEAVVSTGLATRLGELVLRVGGSSETRLLAMLMGLTAAVGAFMSSTAVVALFIPAAITISNRSGIDRRRLLMPLSAAGLISGMMTLIATAPNLVVDEALRERGLSSLGFFGFTPFGIVTLIVAIGYMLAVGRRLLATKAKATDVAQRTRTVNDLADAYGLTDRVARLRVLPASPLHDRTVARMALRTRFGVVVVGFDKGRGQSHVFIPAEVDTVFRVGDAVYVVGDEEQVAALCEAMQLSREPRLPERSARQALQRIGFAEVMLAPASPLIGQTIGKIEFRSRFKVSVLAVRHRGEAQIANLADTRLDFGDALLVSGSWEDIQRLGRDRDDFVLLAMPEEHKDVAPTGHRAPAALVILAAMVVAMASGVVPTVAAATIAALAMLAFGCLRLESVYRSIGWPTVVLIAGILPLATALTVTGVSALLADALVSALGSLGVLGMLATVFALTAVIGLFISNTATAVLIAPIAIDAAIAIGASPQAFAMTVAIASSAAFATPVSSPVNTLVYEPGGYSFLDFVKVGVPLMLLALVITVLMAAGLYPT